MGVDTLSIVCMMECMARLTRRSRLLLLLTAALLLAWGAPAVPIPLVGPLLLFGALAWLFLFDGDATLLQWIDRGPEACDCEACQTEDQDDGLDDDLGGGRSA